MNIRNKIIAALLAFLMLFALIGCSDETSEGHNTEVSLRKYADFTKSFNDLLVALPDYSIEHLQDVPLEDDITCHIYTINDSLIDESYGLSIETNTDNEITSLILNGKIKSYGNIDFALFAYYSYVSMGFTPMDADDFYDKFDLLSKEDIFESSTYSGYDLTSITIEDNNQISFLVQLSDT